jgi:hypothetical protein
VWHAGVVLALTVMAALTRAPAVAADPELHGCIPSIARLLRSRTLPIALSHPNLPADNATTAAAQEAALDALLHMCANDDAGARIAVESGVCGAVATWLRSSTHTAGADALSASLLVLAMLLQPGGLAGDSSKASQSIAFEHLDEHAHDSQLAAALAALAHCAAASLCDSARDSLEPAAADTSGPANTQPAGRPADTKTAAAATAPGPSAAVPGSGPGKGAHNAPPRGSRAESEVVGNKRGLQLRALAILGGIVPSLPQQGADGAPAAPVAHEGLAWLGQMQRAVLRVLRTRLPPAQLAPALSALVSATQLYGPGALIINTSSSSAEQGADSEAPSASALLVAAVETIKVQVFSHLQGAVLCLTDVQDGPEVMLQVVAASSATFELCLRLFIVALDLLMLMESAPELRLSESSAGDPLRQRTLLLAAALADNIVTQVRANNCPHDLPMCASLATHF